MCSIKKEGTMTINSTTTITVTDLGDELDIEFDPPDTSPHTAGPLLFKAAWGEAIRGGMSRATFVSFLRDCADQIEAMTTGNTRLANTELSRSFINDDGQVRWRLTAARKKAIEKGVPLPPAGRCELDS
jgi:hypothetical protein